MTAYVNSRKNGRAAGRAADGSIPAASERAFVLQLAADCAADPTAFKGRVQHLTSADGGNFETLDGLFAIIRRVLSQREQEDEGD